MAPPRRRCGRLSWIALIWPVDNSPFDARQLCAVSSASSSMLLIRTRFGWFDTIVRFTGMTERSSCHRECGMGSKPHIIGKLALPPFATHMAWPCLQSLLDHALQGRDSRRLCCVTVGSSMSLQLLILEDLDDVDVLNDQSLTGARVRCYPAGTQRNTARRNLSHQAMYLEDMMTFQGTSASRLRTSHRKLPFETRQVQEE
ncbi:hypothetical protein GGR56DRAFT_301520 [Xylariaceae sp. FL0804]|nr:hypothetical protein GGR56DRAFT_301520 [Xylariaceae sp. FL0804]